MSIFRYKGRKPTGEMINGELETRDISDVVQFLRNQNVIPLDIVEINPKFNFPEFLAQNIPFFKVGLEELMIFCRQMSTLIGAGVTLITSLRQLSESTKSKLFGKTLQDINKKISAGQSLTQALSFHERIFSALFINIIEVGENTGRLKESFQQLANYFGNAIVNKRRIKSAMRYPTMVTVAILAALFVMNILVIPKFTAIFKSFSAELPFATKILIASSNFMTEHWLLLLLTLIVLIWGWRYLLMIPKFKIFWDKHQLSIPVFGNLQKRIIIAQFAWSSGLILRSGVHINRAIQLAAQTTNNMYISRKIVAIRDDIEQGKSFTNAVSRSDLFPLFAVQMISVGEETGCLEEMLIQISDAYNEEIEYDMSRLSDLLQPMLLTIVGAMVLVLAIGIYMPLWDLIKVVR